MEQPQNQTDFLPNLPNPNLTPIDGVQIGQAPVPGITLKRILRGHTDAIHRIAWSPNGRFLASPSRDKTIRIWDVVSGECTAVLRGHTLAVNSVTWSPDSQTLASASMDKTIRIWNITNQARPNILTKHTDHVYCVRWSPNGGKLASGSFDKTIHIWDTKNWTPIQTLKGHTGYGVASLLWTPDGQLISGGAYEDHTIRLWDIQSGECLKVLRGHNQAIQLAWANQQNKLISASLDRTMRIWNTETWQPENIIEAHSDEVVDISTSTNGYIFASKSVDNSVRLWNTTTLHELAKIEETTTSPNDSGLAFHPQLPYLATLGEQDKVIRIWEIKNTLLPQIDSSSFTATRYTTAKLALVGDSGVGKTGLGWRMAHDDFKEHSSTHGQQFWLIPKLHETREDGTECDVVVWDLAGQHVYRPIHSIFLNNVDTALILFDPTNRHEPFKGVEFWLAHLQSNNHLPPSILIGARSDRGQSTLSKEDLDQFCQENGISGGYISTSAKTGEGIDDLFDRLRGLIPWDDMITTVTTRTFKRIKDYVLALKEQPNRPNVLVSPTQLRRQLQTVDPYWEFTDAELITAVGHLENHGYVTILKSASGEEHILLAPDLLATLAASIVLLADNHTRELGAVNETELLQGSHPFDELQGLDQEEQRILLDAAVLRFVEHNICFREQLQEHVLLIFPAFIKQKKPPQDNNTTDDITYLVRGQVENIYASLVVLLSYTPTFSRLNQWQNQAQYRTEEGYICGFRLGESRESEIELTLSYSDGIPPAKMLEFESLFEQLLSQLNVDVTPFPPVHCPNGHYQARELIVNQQKSGKNHFFCNECGQIVVLFEIAESSNIGLSAAPWLLRQEAQAHLRSAYETYLGRVKGYRRNYTTPRCYISHLPQQEKFANRLGQDLNKAGLFIIEDPTQVQTEDYILLLSTPAYHQVFSQEPHGLQHDIPLIQSRLDDGRHNLIALDLEDNVLADHDLNGCKPGNFTIDTHYLVSLFDLVLDLYRIPFNSHGFAPLRQSLHQQWEETLMIQKIPAREVDAPILLDILNDNLSIEDLEMITFGLVDDYDNIPGRTKAQKIREMIIYFQNRGQLEMFLKKLARHRPDINLDNIYK